MWSAGESAALLTPADASVAARRWWDLSSLQQTHSIQFAAPITSMEKSHDGQSLSLTSGKTVSFISLSTKQPFIEHTLPYAPSTASLHPIDPRSTFVTGDMVDGWVRVHDVATGDERECGKGHHGPVHAISYSPDGEMYASGSEDGTIRLWLTVPKNYGLWRFEGL